MVDWLSGLLDKMKHGSRVLSQETMTELGVPVEGMNIVHVDFAALRQVFGVASQDDSCVGRAVLRTAFTKQFQTLAGPYVTYGIRVDLATYSLIPHFCNHQKPKTYLNKNKTLGR